MHALTLLDHRPSKLSRQGTLSRLPVVHCRHALTPVQNLAYAEMRLILAKMIWSFDLELDPRSQDWSKECKVMLLWDKPELAVRVKEVVRS